MDSTRAARRRQRSSSCRACPRLVAWREEVAAEKRAAFRDEDYWGRPVPGFGDPSARVVVVGLAPAAHGANRTGRMFTGDRSGDWLYGALHRAGLANQPTSDESRRRPAPDRRVHHRCGALRAARRTSRRSRSATRAGRTSQRELALLANASVFVALGAFAYEALCRVLGVRPRPKFGHGVEVALDGGRTILCSFHPSQQNTFTGKLTRDMLDRSSTRAVEIGHLGAT